MTEASAAEEELARRLDQVDALRRRVLNVIPHALRTPITTLRGLAEALPNANAADIHEFIGPALRRLAAQSERLLDDMLIAAGLTTALPTGNPEPTPVLATARAMWADLEQPAAELRTLGDEQVEALAPPGSLGKIFRHLLDNAYKYDDRPVTVSVSTDSGRVLVEIHAPGPTPADLAMGMEPFYRSEAAVMRSPGLGVGLTVSRALAEQAGGTLEVEPGQPDGVTAKLELKAP